MLTKRDHKSMGRSQMGWLDSHFHFSFAEYYNPQNMQFGVLRVINDDLIQPHTGFDTHPHKDMEIFSYVIDGALSHADSMGNQRTLTRGQVQYMSAGTGITHSEHNLGSEVLRLLQIWVMPDRHGHLPNYGEEPFSWDARVSKWLHMAGGDKTVNVPIRMHADINLYATYLPAGSHGEFPVHDDRQAYLVLAEGTADVNGHQLQARDGMEIVAETIHLTARQDAHIVLIEMAKA